ncbi:MAG: AsmA-like C-terminal region-containing protein, partial [Woeseiaceae bacterium]
TAEDHVGSNMELQLSSNNLGEVASVFGISGLPERPIEMQGRAKIVNAGIEATEDIVANVEKISIAVNGLFAREKGLRGSDLNVRISGPNLAALAADFGVSKRVPHEAYSIGGKVLVRDSDIGLSRVTGTVGRSSIQVDGRLVAGKRLAGSEFKVAANGPALEQLAQLLDPVTVAAGPYDVSGTVAFKSDSVGLRDFRLVRDRGEADFDIEFGLAPASRSIRFDVNAKGPDIRAALQNYKGFEPATASFILDTRGYFSDARWSFDKYELTVGKARMQANGTLDFRGEGEESRFNFSGDIPSLAAIGQFQGRQFRDQSLSWQAIVTSNNGIVDIGDLHGRLGDSEITGSARVSIAEIPEVSLDIQSDSLVLVPLLAEEMATPDEDEVVEDTRLIPDFELPVQALRKLNGTINLRIGKLQREKLHLEDLVLRADLRDGRLDVSRLAFNAPSGHLAARALIQPAGDSADVSLAVVARDFAVGLFGQNQDLEMTGDVDIKVASTGGSLRQLAANANGVVFAEVRGGQVADMAFLNLFYGDMFSQILGTISPLLVSNTEAQLECAIFPYEISDGQLSSVPYTFFGTDSIRISSDTRVDLATEELDLDVRTSATKGVKLSAGQVLNPHIKVIGTLAEPQVAVDAQGTIISGGAAVASGGLTILAKMGLERLFGSKDPCTDIAKQARDALGDRFPELSTVTSE